jgi:hypothetical protein
VFVVVTTPLIRTPGNAITPGALEERLTNRFNTSGLSIFDTVPLPEFVT